MTELIGSRIGQYELQEYVGSGGMAHVYKAFHARLRTHRAIKVLRPERSQDPGFVQAFSDEAVTAARLIHPNIVQIYDVGDEGTRHFIIMEFAPGGTLKQLIRPRAGLLLRQVCDLFDQIAEALNCAHSQGFVHCDVKPTNILLDDHGRVKLADFGIARAATESSAADSRQRLVGSPRYMSPEHVQGGRNLDHRSDIYSLGVVLFEMLTGQVPFEDSHSTRIMEAHVSQKPPKPSTVNPSLPPAVDVVVLRALDKSPDKRYQNALQMARDLRRAVAGNLEVPPPPPPDIITPPPPPPKPRPRWPLFAATGVVLSLLGYAFATGILPPAGGATPTPLPVRPAASVPGASPTPAEIILPTATPPPPGGPTSTLVRTPTPAPPTPLPPTPLPPPMTRVPTRDLPAPQYSAPVLLEPADGADARGRAIRFRWSWPGQLRSDEYFELWVWPRGEAERALQGLKVMDATVDVPGGVGVYFWKVRVVRGELGKPGAVALSPWSEVRSFDRKQLDDGTQPEPTRPGEEPKPEPTRP